MKWTDSGLNDLLSIRKRQRALERWEAHTFVAEDAADIARTRRSRESWEDDEFDPSRPSYSERDAHPEAEW